MSRPLLLGIFALSLAFRLWFNFVYPHVNNAGAADGSEYLRLAHALDRYFSQPHSDLSILSGFKQSGPVFPLFILFCQKVGGFFGSFPDSAAPVFGQCLLASLADVFLCLTANLLWGRQCALFGAAFTILYPAYLINTGRLYAESFSTSLSVILLYAMCRGFVGAKRNWIHFLSLGAGLASLQLARSVMILLSAVSLPLTFFQERKSGAFKAVGLLIIGMALVMIPWLCAQKAVLNKASLVVDRVGNYNLFVGTNPDISGWLSYPYPDGTGIENRSQIAVLSGNLKRSWSRSLKLMLDKPFRLAKFPWNDFRTEVGLFTFPVQVAFHQILLLLCAVGVCLSFVANADGQAVERGVFRGRLLLLLYLASHAIYWFFITVPRYNMTATPVLIMFAAAGAASILSVFKRNHEHGILLANALVVLFLSARLSEIGLLFKITGNPSVSLLILCAFKASAAILFFLLLWKFFPRPADKPLLAKAVNLTIALISVFLVAYPARANGRSFEWQALLSHPGEKISQQIRFNRLDTDVLANRQLYLLIDTDGAGDFVENGLITVNGEQLQGPLIPGISLTQDFSAFKYMGKEQEQIYYECEWIYDCMTVSADRGSCDIRQWFVLPLPPKVVSKIVGSGLADIQIQNKSGIRGFKVFGNYQPVSLFPSIYSSSWEKAFYGVENDRGFTDSRYDVKLDLARHEHASFVEKSPDLSPLSGIQSGMYNLLITATSKGKDNQVFTYASPFPKNLSLKNSEAKTCSTNISSLLAPTASETWIFRLKGRSSVAGASKADRKHIRVEPKVKVVLNDDSGKTFVYPCRWLPRSLPAFGEPTRFDYCFPMMPGLLKEKISSVEVTFLRHDTGYSVDQPLEIEDLAFEIIPLPNNPISSQNPIY
ncbi:MAG: hypothetical protein K2Y39_19525 [Candidatus Obscuribacterales bacterium]|nr:hypothetical protein [Candidatus Obscuribacterales bacterium]